MKKMKVKHVVQYRSRPNKLCFTAAAEPTFSPCGKARLVELMESLNADSLSFASLDLETL